MTQLSLIVQIALGMRCLHAHGIVHRDLKASNILVVDSASHKVDVVIADYESSSQVEGTGYWRAPEVLRVLKTKSERAPLLDRRRNVESSDVFSLKSDVYSFGMTCYEILTGKLPLNNLLASDYNAVLSGRRPELPGDINPKLGDLVRNCWHAAPEKRPTFCEIILELRHVVAEMGLPPIHELVTCFNDEHLFPAASTSNTTAPNLKLAIPATVSLFVENLKLYVKHYGWKFFLGYHLMSPEEAVQVLKRLDHIEDHRCEIWRRLPDETILCERCSNINSIFVLNAAMATNAGNFELGEEYEEYVSELRSRWVSDPDLDDGVAAISTMDSDTEPGEEDECCDEMGGTRMGSNF